LKKKNKTLKRTQKVQRVRLPMIPLCLMRANPSGRFERFPFYASNFTCLMAILNGYLAQATYLADLAIEVMEASGYL